MEDIRKAIKTFPGPLTLFPVRIKWIGLALACVAFAALGIYQGGIVGNLIVVFFAGGLLFALITLLPGSSSLRLDKIGLDVTRLFRKRSFSWGEVTDLRLEDVSPPNALKPYRRVVFTTSKPYRALLGTSRTRIELKDTYGMYIEDLLELMTTWQKMALDADKRAKTGTPLQERP